jgi:hypothetical protein
MLRQITDENTLTLDSHNEESEVAEKTLSREVDENTISNVDYPKVDEENEVETLPSEDVNSQW